MAGKLIRPKPHTEFVSNSKISFIKIGLHNHDQALRGYYLSTVSRYSNQRKLSKTC